MYKLSQVLKQRTIHSANVTCINNQNWQCDKYKQTHKQLPTKVKIQDVNSKYACISHHNSIQSLLITSVEYFDDYLDLITR